MAEALSGPEKLMQMMMKSMGINPQDLIAKFQEPIEKGLAGIKDVDSRLAKLENDVSRILYILEQKDARTDRPELRVIDVRSSADDSPFDDDEHVSAARLAG